MSVIFRSTSSSSLQIRFPENPASTRMRVVGVMIRPQLPALEDPSIRKDGLPNPSMDVAGMESDEGCAVRSDMEIDKQCQKMREIMIVFLIILVDKALVRVDPDLPE